MFRTTLSPQRGLVLAGFAMVIGAIALVPMARLDSSTAAAESAHQPDIRAGREAFLKAYPVFMHPRCMNCHPAGDAPLQGEDSRPHSMSVKRGPAGIGLYAMKCANCHQDVNLPGGHMPPGHPQWHLPPEHMKMVFEGKSPRELAQQMVDPEQNGGKTLEQLLEHMEHDSLVLTGWNPAEGLSKPPLSHEEFARLMREWINNGAPAPE